MPEPIVVTLLARPSIVIGALDRVVFGLWLPVPSKIDDAREAVRASVDYLKSSAKQDAGFIVAIHAKTAMPDEDLRAMIQREMPRLDPHVCCGATILARDGFAGAAVRAILSTMQLVTRPSHPEKVVASGDEAARYVAGERAKRGASSPSERAIADAFRVLAAEHWR